MGIGRILEQLLQEHSRFHDRALDWFIASWDLKGAEKEFSLAKYQEYSDKAHQVTLKMLEVLKDGRTD